MFNGLQKKQSGSRLKLAFTRYLQKCSSVFDLLFLQAASATAAKDMYAWCYYFETGDAMTSSSTCWWKMEKPK